MRRIFLWNVLISLHRSCCYSCGVFLVCFFFVFFVCRSHHFALSPRSESLEQASVTPFGDRSQVDLFACTLTTSRIQISSQKRHNRLTLASKAWLQAPPPFPLPRLPIFFLRPPLPPRPKCEACSRAKHPKDQPCSVRMADVSRRSSPPGY